MAGSAFNTFKAFESPLLQDRMLHTSSSHALMGSERLPFHSHHARVPSSSNNVAWLTSMSPESAQKRKLCFLQFLREPLQSSYLRPATICHSPAEEGSDLSTGKAITSRMLGLSVSNITRRSMPMPWKRLHPRNLYHHHARSEDNSYFV